MTFLWQGDPLHVLAGGDICFAPPFGDGDEEVSSNIDRLHIVFLRHNWAFKMCLCKTDACNENSSTAKTSLGIHQTAEWVVFKSFVLSNLNSCPWSNIVSCLFKIGFSCLKLTCLLKTRSLANHDMLLFIVSSSSRFVMYFLYFLLSRSITCGEKDCPVMDLSKVRSCSDINFWKLR